MEGLSIIIPVFNKIETTLNCVQSIAKENSGSVYQIVIVDNGSTDETEAIFSGDPRVGAGLKPAPAVSDSITYIRNPENLGVSRALNIGAASAQFDTLCFMHNDVIVHERNWTARIAEFISSRPDAGIVGFYGAKTIRKDGSFRGKSIVHSKKTSPSINRPFEIVAVVDGLLMTLKKDVFVGIGGFSDEFIMHFYDKDISMKAVTGTFMNYVLNVPFEHACAATRTEMPEDDHVRDEAKKLFLEKWAASLPVDVTTWREKLYSLGRRKRAD